MRNFLGFFRAPTPKLPLLKEVHAALRPNFLFGTYTGLLQRHKSMEITLNEIIDPIKYKNLYLNATKNLKDWSANKVEAPLKVEVLPYDWGNATLLASQKYGQIYTVLNMANADFPGGAVLEGGSAQEENMWHRSTCALTLLDKGIYLDKENNFRYDDKTKVLISAEDKMSDEELTILSQERGEQCVEGFKVYLNHKPQICFRGPELVELSINGEKSIPDSSLSFIFMPKDLIFPFNELRSAAPDLSETRMDGTDVTQMEHYKNDLRRRISAQLDTLIIAGKTHVILGAWGCGAFKNKPNIVAQIYREEIEKRAQCFEHIVFPVINTQYRSENFNIFHESLNGMKLGRLVNQLTSKATNAHHSQFFSSSEKGFKIPEETPENGPQHHN